METLLQKAQRLGIQPQGRQQPQQSGGFFSNILNKANERADSVGNILHSNQDIRSKALQVFGQGTGLGADIIGAGVSAVTPDFIEKPVTEAIGSGVQAIAQTAPIKKFVSSYQKMATAHPELAGNIGAIGNILNLAASLEGASLGSKTAASTVVKSAELSGKGLEKAGEGVGTAAKFVTSQATGLNPQTISQVLKTPGFFTKKEMASIDRQSIANKVKTAVDKRLEQLSETGKGYETIRKSGQNVSVPQGTIESVLSKYGIGVKDGKLITTAESVPISKADKTGIEEFIKQYGGSNLSGNGFLNARKALSNIAKYDALKTDISQKISRDLRSAFDNLGKETLPGLKELDTQYAPEVRLLNKVKKDILNPDGSLKDTAISKIANLTGKGKEKVLARLEQIIPGIRTDVNILKSIEDIEYTGGQKVGAYLRGATGGFVASGGNPVAAVVTAIATSPGVAIPLIRGYAKVSEVTKSLLDSTIGKMQRGIKLTGNELKLADEAIQSASSRIEGRIKSGAKEIRPGLNIQDVNTMTPEQLNKAGVRGDPSVGETALMNEARKYKTAEAFVKAQGEPMYHGTPYKFDEFKNGHTTFFTPSKSFAENYGRTKSFDNKMDADIAIHERFGNVKLFNPNNPSELSALEKLLPDEIQTTGTWGGTKVSKKEALLNMQGKMTVEPNPRYNEVKVGETFFDNMTGNDYKVLEVKPKSIVVEDIRTYLPPELRIKELSRNNYIGETAPWGAFEGDKNIEKSLKKLGYDGWKMTEGGKPTYGIFDVSKLKTKSQLTEIWKKANEPTKRGFGTGAGRTAGESKTNLVKEASTKIDNYISNLKPKFMELDAMDALDELKKMKTQLSQKSLKAQDVKDIVGDAEKLVKETIVGRSKKLAPAIKSEIALNKLTLEAKKYKYFNDFKKANQNIDEGTLKRVFIRSKK